MANDRDRRSAYGTVGPEDPTRPSMAEQEENEPVAVANEKTSVHGKSFLPSTASMDQWDEEVARKWRRVPPENGGAPYGQGTTASREMNREMEDPPGYEIEKETGWKKLEEFGSDAPGKVTAKQKDDHRRE